MRFLKKFDNVIDKNLIIDFFEFVNEKPFL